MTDPIDHLSDEQLRLLAADVTVQLEKGTGTRPILFMLKEARHRAIKAFGMLIEVPPDDANTIRQLQNELKLYADMIHSCRAVLDRGKTADRRINEDDRAAIDEVVMNMSDEERRLHNFEARSRD